jgi:nitrogen fixation protein NifU and related proteins
VDDVRETVYRDHILDLYKYPHNFGKLKSCTYHHKESNPLCGDEIEMFVKIAEGHVAEVKFTGVGCAICMASSSLLTDWVKKKTTREIKDLKNEDVYSLLHTHVSPSRVKCALLPMFVLKNGLTFYERGKDESS